MRLEGKTAVVSGGASGLGREVVLGMAREGANVVVFDRDGDGARRVVEEVKR